ALLDGADAHPAGPGFLGTSEPSVARPVGRADVEVVAGHGEPDRDEGAQGVVRASGCHLELVDRRDLAQLVLGPAAHVPVPSYCSSVTSSAHSVSGPVPA